MNVALGSDHGGLELKEKIKKLLDEMNISYNDYGTDEAVSCDYSDYAIKVSEAVANKEYERGILICNTGIGMSISANKVKGVRAALVENVYSARLTRLHNDSNVLCLGAKVIGEHIALEIVRVWLGTDFEGGRHQRRLDKISEYESK